MLVVQTVLQGESESTSPNSGEVHANSSASLRITRSDSCSVNIGRVQSFLVSDSVAMEIVQCLSYWYCRVSTMLDDLISLATLEDHAGGV